MNQDPASLSNLHDIVLPPEISWWPLSPGWWVIVAVVFLLLFLLARRAWKRWMANAYRRAALQELAAARDAATVAELLRRTALAVAPRSEIASLTGEAWLDWLDSRASSSIPDEVRNRLGRGLYAPEGSAILDEATRAYAAHWIRTHTVA